MDSTQPRGITSAHLEAITLITRVCSVFSLVGSLSIILTFCFSKHFHKPINRMVFYATFGNVMSSIGTYMARSYVDTPHARGCQLQAFLIQVFMPADAYWTLAMAINVYIVFFQRFDAKRLCRLEWIYFVLCYGIPLVPALVFLLKRPSSHPWFYGNATLWCWIVDDWEYLRIATFYGPVWLVILVTMSIYIRVGWHIRKKRRPSLGFRNVYSFAPVPETYQQNMDSISARRGAFSKSAPATVDWNISDAESLPSELPGRANDHIPAKAQRQGSSSDITRHGSSRGPEITISHPQSSRARAWRRNRKASTTGWAYTKCASLFFSAILITWAPSTTNRLYSIFHHGEGLVSLEFMSAFVLPLQGFWNAFIYIFTSWNACQLLGKDLLWWRRRPTQGSVGQSSIEQGSRTSNTSGYQRRAGGDNRNDSQDGIELRSAHRGHV